MRENQPARVRPGLRGLACALLVAGLSGGEAASQPVSTPNFWDQRQRLQRPALPALTRLRFLTSAGYPPFNFLDSRGRLTGFNVDLARAICEELGLTPVCQIEAKPFDQLLPALKAKDGEAIVAGLAMTADNREQAAFTQSYFRYPARFATRRQAPLPEDAADLAGRRIAVVRATAHEAMLRAFFPKALATPFDNRDAALSALRAGQVEAFFGDGIGLSFWLASEAANDCCAFSGGPFLSDRFLGEGLAIAVAPDDPGLARAFDYAIGQLVEKGTFSELMLRYFPISAF